MNEVVKVDESEAVQPVDPMVSVIERMALDQNSDIEKLERMLAMKERLDKEGARRSFSDAMAACQAEMGPVARNKSNDQTNSMYADLAAIYKACKPIIARHGFSFSTFPASTEKQGHMGVRWTLRHSCGHEETGLAELPLDDAGLKGTKNKTGTHAFGSTASYARRYLFCMLFDIATGDDNDGNTVQSETVSPQQYVTLRDALELSGMEPRSFHMAFGHKDPDSADLQVFPASRFDEAIGRLKAYKKRKEAANV